MTALHHFLNIAPFTSLSPLTHHPSHSCIPHYHPSHITPNLAPPTYLSPHYHPSHITPNLAPLTITPHTSLQTFHPSHTCTPHTPAPSLSPLTHHFKPCTPTHLTITLHTSLQTLHPSHTCAPHYRPSHIRHMPTCSPHTHSQPSYITTITPHLVPSHITHSHYTFHPSQ